MPYDIGKAFERIEKELMQSMIRNMEHHKAEEIKEGFEWSQWQVEQLRALEEYRKRNNKKFPKKFQDINSKIPHLVKEARAAGQMDQEADILEAISKGFRAKKGSGDITGAFFEVNDRKLNALIDATTNDFERAEVAILRRAEDQYRQVIFDAQVYANAGGTTYEKAVDMATKDYISKGIDCIEYSNGARHTLSDYADMAIRTAVKRAYLTGEGEKRQEWGIATVIVNKRGNPCPKCAPFCGKVMIDDVWSGGSRKDGPYPLMSLAIEHGLYHPRCRDSHTTYFPGISTADDTWSKEELEEIGANYEADQRQQYAKRQADKYERLADTRLDPENKRQCEARAEEWRTAQKRKGERGNQASNPQNADIGNWISVLDEYLQGADPGNGEIKLHPSRTPKNKEKDNAVLIRDTFGGDIILLDETDTSQKNPDYLWRGKLWEQQGMERDSKNSVDQNIREGIQQIREKENPGGIILDASISTLKKDELSKIIFNRLRRSSPIDCDVILIRNSSIEDVFRYKKTTMR